MERTPVESSNLVSVGYDKTTKTLEVEFKRGGIYQYEPVSKTVYKAFMNSDSKGKYFIEHIKENHRYKTTKIK